MGEPFFYLDGGHFSSEQLKDVEAEIVVEPVGDAKDPADLGDHGVVLAVDQEEDVLLQVLLDEGEGEQPGQVVPELVEGLAGPDEQGEVGLRVNLGEVVREDVQDSDRDVAV